MLWATDRVGTSARSWKTVSIPSERAWSTERRTDLLAVDEQPAAVGAMQPAQHLDERRLARAVIADETETLSLLEMHRDVDERGDSAEALGDVLHPEGVRRSAH